MPQNNELRVFISSTFRDLQEEREHLVKKIFPEIRVLCRERGITFTEVDLRWGLTDEDVALGQVIRTCMEEVDRCRPYFIGITGDRYGYIPTYIDIQKDPTLLEQFPWVEDAVLNQMSITEMEAHYAVLDSRSSDAQERARFYFRRHRATLDDDDDDDMERSRLAAYQERIRACGVRIEEYRDASLLGELIHDDLIEIIKRDFADATPPTPLEQERLRHEAFSLSRRRAYIANPEYLKQLNDHVASDDPPLVVYAESGSGKSSLFAYWAEQYRRKHPDAHVIEHYVGIGATSTDHYGVIRHVCMEVKERFNREEEIPSEPQQLDLALGQWLGYADHELKKRGERMVLILDGLNQLQGAALNLRWIPDVISPSIRLILSSTVEGTLVELRKRGWVEYGMQALSEAERDAIVVRYLAEYRKSLSTDQIRRIAGDYKCGHPLFLKTLLEELRLVGRHEELEIRIQEYLSATGTEDLFQKMLERMEEDHGARAVRDVLVMLWGSRFGLSERELSEVTGLSRLKVATMVAGLEYHLVKKEGQLTFFHDYLRRAVEKRYLHDRSRKQQMRVELARYFEGVPLTQRSAMELLWQYGSDSEVGESGEHDKKLAVTLARPDVLLLLFRGETRFEMLERWTQLLKRGYSAEEEYRRSLKQEEALQSPIRGELLAAGAKLLESLSQWEVAGELYGELIEWSRAHKRSGDEIQGHVGLGWIKKLRCEYDDAVEHLTEGKELASKLGDQSRKSIAIGNMGVVHRELGRYAEAMECFGRQLMICEELGDRKGMATAIGNMGVVHADQGRYPEAMECYGRLLAISEELGDRCSVSIAIGNMGTVHRDQGRITEAMECFRRDLAICEELGDRHGMVTPIGNMGDVHSKQGRYAEALECFGRQLAISEELGDRREMSAAFSGMGGVHWQQGRFSEAMECYGRQLAISEAIGDRWGVSSAFGDMGIVHRRQGQYAEALECYGRQIKICEELGNRSGMSTAIGNMGILYASRGELERALGCYVQASEEHRTIGFRYALANWLNETADTLLKLLDKSVGEMPEYLSAYLPGATSATWRVLAIQHALECVKESVAISDDLSQTDMQFSGRILLGRIEAAEGHGDAAIERLNTMLAEAGEDEQQAELHYWLWKLGAPDAATHHSQSLSLYSRLIEKTPNHDYRQRIDELTAATTTPEATNAPE